MKAMIMDMRIVSHKTRCFLMFGHVVDVGAGKQRGLPENLRWIYISSPPLHESTSASQRTTSHITRGRPRWSQEGLRKRHHQQQQQQDAAASTRGRPEHRSQLERTQLLVIWDDPKKTWAWENVHLRKRFISFLLDLPFRKPSALVSQVLGDPKLSSNSVQFYMNSRATPALENINIITEYCCWWYHFAYLPSCRSFWSMISPALPVIKTSRFPHLIIPYT